MSIGNIKSSGSKGSNYSFQSKNLRLLTRILASLGGGATVEVGETDDITGTAGTTSAALRSVTFVNIAGTLIITGHSFPEGTYTFNNPNGTLAGISYDATGSTNCKILTQK